MKPTFLIFVLLASFSKNFAQNPFVGTFTGVLNGDNIILTMQATSNNTLVGKMKDSQQTYEVNATTNSSKLEGTAVEKTFGLTFILNGTLNGNRLLMNLTIDVLGQKQTMQVDFLKQGGYAAASKNEPPLSEGIYDQYIKPKIPSNGKIDANLVGKWINEQHYNSGSGDNFFGSTSTQSLIFFADGSMSDGGSSTTVSGSNYYGNASDKGQPAPLPNVIWYVQNQHIFIVGSENGQTQTLDLGKYYVENGALLITGNNGKKLLLQKR